MKRISKCIHYIERPIEELILKTPISYPIYRDIAYKYYRWKFSADINRYEAPLTIFKRVQIDPSEIIYFTGREIELGMDRRSNIGTIKKGRWDKKQKRHKKYVEESKIFIGLNERFIENKCWEETTLFRWAVDLLERGRNWHGCSSKKEIKYRLKRIDELYYRIKNHGYKTQEQINGARIDFVNKYLNEVCIDIGRDGELLFVDGRHRLSIAKILELDQIPVFVLVRHESWMEKRDAVYTGETEHLYHPDITELGPSESQDCA